MPVYPGAPRVTRFNAAMVPSGFAPTRRATAFASSKLFDLQARAYAPPRTASGFVWPLPMTGPAKLSGGLAFGSWTAGAAVSEPLPSTCQRQHAIGRAVALTFRRRGRSGRRAWPRACPWLHKWRPRPAASCPLVSQPSSSRSRKRSRPPAACAGGRPRAWSG
jgi:hypothetical protein